MLRIISLIVFFSLLTLIVLYVAISTKGEKMFADAIRNATGRQTTVRDAGVILPMTLRLDGIKIEGLLEATEAQVSLNFSELIKGNFKFDHVSLLYPIIYLERSPEGKLLFGQKVFRTTGLNIDRGYDGSQVRENAIYQDKNPEQFDISSRDLNAPVPYEPRLIESIHIEEGRIVLTDLSRGSKKAWVIDEVFLDASNVPLNHYPLHTEIDMTASLSNTKLPFMGHPAHFKGWVNWAHRDMDAILTVSDDQDGVALKANLFSENNALTVTGTIRLGGHADVGGSESGLEDALKGVLLALDANVDANFSFQTQMDRIQLSNISFGGNFVSGLDEKSSDEIVDSLKEVKESIDLLKQEEQAAKSGDAAMMKDADAQTGTVSATVE